MAQIEESVARYLEQLDTDDEFGFCGLPDWNIEGLFALQDIPGHRKCVASDQQRNSASRQPDY